MIPGVLERLQVAHGGLDDRHHVHPRAWPGPAFGVIDGDRVGAHVGPAQANELLDALPAGEQVQAQTPTAQARQSLDQSSVGAQFVGGQRSLVSAVEPSIAACLRDRVGLNAIGLEGDRNRRRHPHVHGALVGGAQVGSQLV